MAVSTAAKRVIAVLWVAVATACGLAPSSPSPSMPASRDVPIPLSVNTGVVWLEENGLFLARYGDTTASRPQVVPWTVGTDGSGLARVPIEDDLNCRLQDFLAPVLLAPDRVAVIEHCTLVDNDPRGLVRLNATQLEVAGTATHLADLPPGATAITWDPGRSRGIVSAGSRICQGLGWFDAEGWEAFDIVLPGDAERRPLGAELVRAPGADCADDVRADLPVWAADIDLYAFAASPGSAGRSGQARLDAPWAIYVMSGSDLEPRRVLDGIGYLQGLAISRSGRYLGFSGRYESLPGTYLLDLTSSRVALLAPEESRAMSFAPSEAEVVRIPVAADRGSLEGPVLITPLPGAAPPGG